MNLPSCDLTPGLKGEARARDKVHKQRAWIQWCESNGLSYAGENGPAIRQADLAELRGRERELAFFTGETN